MWIRKTNKQIWPCGLWCHQTLSWGLNDFSSLLECNTVENQPEISPAELVFSFVTGPISIYTKSMPSLVPSSTSSYRSSLLFSLCHHRVLTVCIPPPLKYVIPLWNMYCLSEICIATLKYVLPLQNMLSKPHNHVRKPSLWMSTSTTAPRTCM